MGGEACRYAVRPGPCFAIWGPAGAVWGPAGAEDAGVGRSAVGAYRYRSCYSRSGGRYEATLLPYSQSILALGEPRKATLAMVF